MARQMRVIVSKKRLSSPSSASKSSCNIRESRGRRVVVIGGSVGKKVKRLQKLVGELSWSDGVTFTLIASLEVQSFKDGEFPLTGYKFLSTHGSIAVMREGNKCTYTGGQI
ncbi:hypothetical protein C5167_006426 [Papaver somniferum]|uniref:Uncharacterized protein n=1 Tax=Papaver somniferum TaxID=3469 RepID=A0A4Y7JHJ1_PAPSO|nr:hypothetical protein C5167_006426 [Papaver somniferum]